MYHVNAQGVDERIINVHYYIIIVVVVVLVTLLRTAVETATAWYTSCYAMAC